MRGFVWRAIALRPKCYTNPSPRRGIVKEIVKAGQVPGHVEYTQTLASAPKAGEVFVTPLAAGLCVAVPIESCFEYSVAGTYALS